MGAAAWETFACRQCGAAVFVAELPARQYRLLDAEPVLTTSGYEPAPRGAHATTPQFRSSTTTSAATWRLHWPTCAGLSPHDRAYAVREVERGARPAADRSAM